MSEDRPKRKRINRMVGAVEVKDDLAFTECLGSKSAKEIRTTPHNINLELWFAKHYHNRDQFVDEDGNQRDIPPLDIEALVTKGLKHLIFYSAVVKGFTFLNHEDYPGIIRVVLKDTYSKSSALSVLIQSHFKNFSKYQITVITAIDAHIHMASGQYCVEFVGDSHSVLKKRDNGKFVEILSCQD